MKCLRAGVTCFNNVIRFWFQNIIHEVSGENIRFIGQNIYKLKNITREGLAGFPLDEFILAEKIYFSTRACVIARLNTMRREKFGVNNFV